MSIPSRLELESRLFGIIKTLRTAHEDVISGKIHYSSYCNLIRQKIKELMIVEMTFQSKDLEMDSVLKDMMVSEEFFALIPQIHEYITLIEQTSDQTIDDIDLHTESERILNAEKKSVVIGKYTIHPIRLAELGSEITGNFITIFDFFKLGLTDAQMLQKNFTKLEKALREFPGLEQLYLDFKATVREITSRNYIIENQERIYDSFEKLYKRYLAMLKNPNNL